MRYKLRWLGFLISLVLVSTSLAGCGADRADHDTTAHNMAMADMSAMPSQVQNAAKTISDAYRFAATHAGELHQIPCYCGCGPMGHRSNYDCYWQEDGTADEHALNCGICVYITQDVREGFARGKSLAEIRTQVDADYSRYGPPTDTAPVAISTQ